MVIKGKIIKGIGGFYYVDAAGVLYECRARGLFRKKSITPLVGDIADVEIISEEEKTGYVINIHERTLSLIRPAVANVDQVLVVFACVKPDFNEGLLDRFLINMEKQDVETVICISKVDIGDDDKVRRICHIYEEAGYRVITFSNKTGEGIDEIRKLIKGRTTVMSGPSGVGKSSLINNLVPGYEAETGEISDRIGRGRNTTRHTEIIPLGDGETYIVDTPGYSSIELMVQEENDIRYYFKEFNKFNDTCRFTGCVHMAEPDCSVKSAVDMGVISPERYESYREIFDKVKSRRKW